MRKQKTEYIRKSTENRVQSTESKRTFLSTLYLPALRSFSAAGLLSTFILIWLVLLPGLCLGAEYYLDANATGAETGLSWQDAWTALAQAQAVLQDGDTCYIRDGDYGSFNEGTGPARNDWIAYRAADGHNNVNFSGISVSHSGNPSYLRFEGVNVYGHTSLNYTSYIYFYNCKFEGSHYNENTHGINSTTTGTAFYVTIDNCEITHFWRGILVRGNSYWTIKNCHIHNIAEDGINLGGGEVSHILIEGNEIHDITYIDRGVGTEHEDCLHYEVPAPSTDIIIRNNKFYDCRVQGLSIYCHRTTVTAIVVENNLVYDIGAYAVPIEGTDEIDIINNTFIDKDTPAQCLRFSLSHAARDTTITNFYNNIVSGLAVDADRGGYSVNIINEGSNILGSANDLSSGYFEDYAGDNYRLAETSPARDFADPAYAPLTDINGNPRDDGAPDAGCYEYIASSFLYGDINGNGEITSYDAALAARYAVGLEVFTDEQRQKADVSGNGEVSAYDAALIAQRAVGLIDRFPVEE